MLSSDVNRLEQTHLETRMLFGQARRDYVAKRAGLMTSLTKSGRFSPQDAERLLESAEVLWLPGFDSFSSRGPNDMASPNTEYLNAIRNEVGVDQFNMFTAALRSFRLAEHQDQQITGQLERFVPPERFALLEAQTNDLEGYRQDLAKMVQEINPSMKLSGVERGFMAEQSPETDPLAQTMTLSLDPSQFNQNNAVHRELFSSVAEGLTEKERAVLDQAFGMATRISRDGGKTWEELSEGLLIAPDTEDASVGTLTDEDGAIVQAGIHIRTEPFERNKTIERASEAFGKMLSDKRKPDPLIDQALKPFRSFFERSANLLQGRGFQSVEDVLKRAKSGEVGARAANIAAKPGIRMPLPQDNPKGASDVRSSISKMTSQQLAMAIRDQKAELQRKRKAQYSLMTKVFRYRDFGGNGVKTHAQSTGNKAQRRDRNELKQLTRGLTALMAEQRNRSRHNVAEVFKMPDPGARQAQSTVKDQFAEQMHRQQRAEMPAQEGNVAVSPSQSTAGRFDVAWHHPDIGKAVPLASDANEAGAFAMIQAFQAVTSGPKSPQAERLVGEINRAGSLNSADISVLRSSDLLDKDLDAAIGKRDLKAFVYPLKTGDVIFQMSDGSWYAGRREEFVAAAKHAGDKHMRAAAEELTKNTGKVVNFERTRDGLSSATSPSVSSTPSASGKQGPAPVDPINGVTAAATAGIAASMAASAGAVHPYRVTSKDPTVLAAAKQELADLPAERLTALRDATAEALSSVSSTSERDALTRGKLLVSEALSSQTKPSLQASKSDTAASPLKIDDSQAAVPRANLNKLSEEDILETYKATDKALNDLPNKQQSSPRQMRDRQHLQMGRTALQEVMRVKGIELHSSNAPKRSQERARKAGPKR